MIAMEPDELRDVILREHPELASSTFTTVTLGWHSVAVDADDRLIFKFPRHETARRALLREAALLEIIHPAVTLAVPRLVIHDGPPLFSRHEKLKGAYLLPEGYAALSEADRHLLAEALGRFYTELHRLDAEAMATAGAGPVEPWQSIDAIQTRAIPALPPELRADAGAIVDEFAALPADPHGMTYGFFDGHGWNMAFDHERGRLNGIYDFADSGFGPVHQEFIYSNFIAPELTEAIIAQYEARTRRRIGRRRVEVLTTVHRLSELAECADHPEHAPAMVRHAADWLRRANR